jgi:hypothetical protein
LRDIRSYGRMARWCPAVSLFLFHLR